MDLVFINISPLLLLMFIALGFLGGFLAGMLGVGGGIVFIPVFQEIVRQHPVPADKVSYVLANSLVIVLAVGIAGTIKQYKLRNTDLNASIVTGVSAIITSLGISYILQRFDINNPALFNAIFAVILVLTAIRMLYGRNGKTGDEEVKLPPLKKFIPAGLFAGVITSLTGLGGGVVMVPYFNKILKLPIKFSTGLSLSVIPLIALPLIIFYALRQPSLAMMGALQTGHILWIIDIPIIIAAMIAAPLGVRFAQKLSSKTLVTVFLAFIGVTLVKILFF